MRKLLPLFLFGFILSACSSGSNETHPIDYATLDTLQTEVALEIGESEDYLPGQLTDLLVQGGNIIAADRASTTIEQFDAEGNHVATIAREGNGPGEVGPYFLLRNGGGDTLMVYQDAQRDYFIPNSQGVYRFLRSYKNSEDLKRPVRVMGPHSDSTYYAIALNSYNFIEARKNENKYESRLLVVVDRAGIIVQDSVHLLKFPLNYAVERGNSVTLYSIPYRAEDQFVVLNNGGYLIARPDSNAIYFYNSGHERERVVSLNVASRPITSRDLDYRLGDMDRPVRNEIEGQMDEAKPPYLNMWASENHIWLHTDTGEDGKEIAVLDFGGNAVGKFMLPEEDAVQQIKGNTIYTIHESPERGDLIRKYEVQF